MEPEFTALKQFKYFDQLVHELFNTVDDTPKTSYAVAYSKKRIVKFKQDLLAQDIELDSIVEKELSSKFTSAVIDFFKRIPKK